MLSKYGENKDYLLEFLKSIAVSSKGHGFKNKIILNITDITGQSSTVTYVNEWSSNIVSME